MTPTVKGSSPPTHQSRESPRHEDHLRSEKLQTSEAARFRKLFRTQAGIKKFLNMADKLASWSRQEKEVAEAVRHEDTARIRTMRRSLEEKDGREWLVGGVDISPDGKCAMAVFSVPSQRCVEATVVDVPLTEPYVAGFLGFREGPAYDEILRRCTRRPDVLLVDGNGVLHPRRAGSACHVGVRNDIPTIGVAKELLVVDGLTKEVVTSYLPKLTMKGHWHPLTGETTGVLGAVLRTTDLVKEFKPIFVSVGHDISLDTAVFLTLACCSYRIPGPLRYADHLGRGIPSSPAVVASDDDDDER